MKIIIMGAGVVGTTSAWYLTQAGHEVTVIDRQPGAGLETSYANGGQISVCHAEPWANYRNLKKAAGWIFKPDAPLLFHLRPDIAQWKWGWQFLQQCRPENVDRNIRALIELGLASRNELIRLREQLGLEYEQRSEGILHYYTSVEELEAARAPTRLMNQLGCDRIELTPQEVLQIEPALAHSRRDIIGGTYTPSDESGNAFIFTRQLAEHAAQAGVNFMYQHDTLQLVKNDQSLQGIQVKNLLTGEERLLTADRYVLSLGSYSPLLARPAGLDLNIYPAKGYSMTARILHPERAPVVSMTDDEYKIVISRLGDRLRVAGTAEFGGYNTGLVPARCEALLRRTEEVLPGIIDQDSIEYWTGLRPATPSNVPYIGQSVINNLWLNTGHGTLGWTMACGSAQRLALQMALAKEV